MGEFKDFLNNESVVAGHSRKVRMDLIQELNEQPVGVRGLRKFVIDNGFLSTVLNINKK